MPGHAKAWKFKRPVSQNKEPFEPKICLYKGVKVLYYHMTVETQKKR